MDFSGVVLLVRSCPFSANSLTPSTIAPVPVGTLGTILLSSDELPISPLVDSSLGDSPLADYPLEAAPSFNPI